jgi:hypothetical protein
VTIKTKTELEIKISEDNALITGDTPVCITEKIYNDNV